MPKEFDILGNAINIQANSLITKQPEGFMQKWSVPTISVIIGIGKDHTAELIMSEDDWSALKSGEKLHIHTI